MPDRSEAAKTVISECLQLANSLPVARRAKLYRGLAEFCGDEKEAADFHQLAHDLELADQKCREFAFHFQNVAAKPREAGPNHKS